VQHAVLALATLAVAAGLRWRGWFDAAAALVLLDVLPLAADAQATRGAEVAGGAEVRVLLLNVHTSNTSYAAVRALIAAEDPDLIALVEVNQAWVDELPLPAYRARLVHPRPDNFGVALYARDAIAGGIEHLGSDLPSIAASVTVRDATLWMIVTHPLPPVSTQASAQLFDHLDAIAARAHAATPALVVGDFNATPWSSHFHRFAERSGLCDSRAGFGIQASFPANLAPMRIPIDHAFASCTVGIRDRRIGPDVGSDHLPVIVDLTLPRPGSDHRPR